MTKRRAKTKPKQQRKPEVLLFMDRASQPQIDVSGILDVRRRLALDPAEIIVDNFAGGGGAGEGVAEGLERPADVAVNHDPEAIAMYRANHPTTTCYINDVYQVDPVEACAGRRVGFAWFSPDCKHHSKAKGGKPRNQKIRGLAWVAVRWAAAVCPRVIALENVEEFLDWGPLHKEHTHGCTGGARERRRTRAGKVKTTTTSTCRKGCLHNKPVEAKKGATFRAFVKRLEKLGYVVEWRVLRACDYGAPTTRKRLFLIARRDGRPIVWPAPTHGPGRALPHRAAAEVVDWSIPCPSIFGRNKPLADKTLARIARGVQKFVLDCPRPFVVPTTHGGDLRVHDSLEPLRTVTGANRGEHAIVVPYLVHRSNGERPEVVDADGTVHAGQAPRIYDIQNALGTIMAQGQKHALCTALLVRHYGGARNANTNLAKDLRDQVPTVTSQDHHSLVAVHLSKMYGTSTGSDAGAPVPTVTANTKGGGHLAAVAAFLVKYSRTGGPRDLSDPVDTLTTRERYALVTVTVDGEEYYVADIGMRMLTARELYRAQGFPEDYEIAPEYDGKPLTKTAQIRMCGNSVCPPLASAIARAQFQEAA